MKKILIANRGEIAIRIIRACQEMNIKTVAIHSSVDKDCLHAKLADESICIGPNKSDKSYLNIPNIISAAEISGADAIHPGYGFLSENPEFASICAEHNITFIGPKAEHIKVLGNKVQARDLAIRAGVQLLPGITKKIDSLAEAKKIAAQIGYPVIIKAAAGGGGKGMKIVRKESEMSVQLQIAQTEAMSYFSNPDVFIEKYLDSPRHVEVQIAADHFGNITDVGERDCSIQRRHQKLVEEAPCSALSEQEREKVAQMALSIASEAGYHSMGTVEFLYQDGSFYFMEMNTRIQVEHPVTEMISNTDLIKEQISIAQNQELSIYSPKLSGHAIECRINAEDSYSFLPSPGKITDYHQPGGLGVRMDSLIYNGYFVPPYYDSLIGKLITFGENRQSCIQKMRRALNELKIDGINTNIDFYKDLFMHKDFVSNNISTNFLNDFFKEKQKNQSLT